MQIAMVIILAVLLIAVCGQLYLNLKHTAQKSAVEPLKKEITRLNREVTRLNQTVKQVNAEPIKVELDVKGL